MATLEEIKTKYTKQYLPGYTGHVPAKNDLFGLTAGEANRLINRTSLGEKSGMPGSTFRDTRTFIKHQSPGALVSAERTDAQKFGNMSRGARNWISGPNHEIYNQHVPGKQPATHSLRLHRACAGHCEREHICEILREDDSHGAAWEVLARPRPAETGALPVAEPGRIQPA